MGLMKKLTSAIVASSLVFSLVGTAAAYQPKDGETAGARMQKLGIIQGRDNTGDLQLNSTITRAEFVTTMVKAFGKEDVAKYLTGSTIFPDISTHWASGYIAMAVNITKEAGGDAIGTDKGTFDPNGQLTPAQAVAFLMKFFGVKRDTTKAWPQDYLSAAVQANLITADDATTVAQQGNTAATRGLVFYLLDNSFYTRKDANGQTVYTKYNAKAPVLDAAAAKTTTSDTKVTISGTVKDAVELYVGSNKVTFGADGAFSYDYAVNMGENPITVTAKSLAGVSATKNLTVTRTTGTAATIDAKLSAQLLKAGTTADLTVVVKDKAGNEIKDAAYDVKVDAAVGTYADGKITAAAAPGTGKVTITAGDASTSLEVAVVAGDLAKIDVTGATSAKIGQALTFTAQGFDAAGNKVDLTNATWSSSKGGVINPTTGEFAGTASGNVTVTAAVGEVKGTATVAIYGDATSLKIAAPTGLVANAVDTKTVSVNVVDVNGSVVGNSTANVTLASSDATKVALVNASGAKVANLTVAAVNGVATFTVVGADSVFAANSVTLSATAPSLTGDLTSLSTVAPTVGKVVLTKTPDTGVYEVSGAVTLSAKILDTTGAQITAPAAFNITLATTAGQLNYTTMAFAAGATAPTAPAQGQVYTLTLPATENSITVTGTTTAGYTIDSAALSTKVAGPAYKMAIVSAPVDNNADSGKFTVKIAVQDGLGTTKTSLQPTSITATAKMAGQTDVTASAQTANGVATLEFRPNVNTDQNRQANPLVKVGTWSITVASNGLIAPDAVTVNVTPGVAAKFGNFTASPATVVANGAHTSTLSVDILDANNNLVPTATNAVTFGRTNTSNFATVLPSTLTVNAVGGKASIVVTSGVLDNVTDTFTVSGKIDDTNYLGGSAGLQGALSATVTSQIVGSVANMGLSSIEGTLATAAQGDPGSIGYTQTAGTAFKVGFKMVDAVGRTVSIDQGRSVVIEAHKVSDDSLVDTQNATVTNGVATASFALTTADITNGYYFKATTTINGSSVTVSSKNTGATFVNNAWTAGDFTGRAIVKAAAPAKVVIKPAMTSVETGTAMGVTVAAQDAYGNNVAGAPTNFAYANTDRLSGIDANSFAATYTAINTEETFTIAEANGVASWTPTGGTVVDNLPVTNGVVTTYIAGPAYKLGVVTAPTNVTTTSPSTTLTIGVYDGAGHLKTNYSDTANTTLQIALAAADNTQLPHALTGGDAADIANGKVTFTLAGATTAGTYNLKATSTGLVDATGISFVATAGTAAKVSDGTATLTADGSSIAVLTFKVTDGVNDANTVTSYTGTMNFTVSGTGATLLQTSAPIVNGQATVTVRATTQAGTFVVTGAVAGTNTGVANGAYTITVNPGVAASITPSVTETATAATVTLVVKDQYGNAVKDQALTVSNVNNVAATDANGITVLTINRPAFDANANADATYTVTLGTITTTFVVHEQAQ